MSVVTVIAKKLYPTPKNCQLTEDAQQPESVAHYLIGLLKQVPESERDSLRLTGWSNVKIEWQHALSVEEQREEKLRQALAMVSGKGAMSAEEVAALHTLLLG